MDTLVEITSDLLDDIIQHELNLNDSDTARNEKIMYIADIRRTYNPSGLINELFMPELRKISKHTRIVVMLQNIRTKLVFMLGEDDYEEVITRAYSACTYTLPELRETGTITEFMLESPNLTTMRQSAPWLDMIVLISLTTSGGA